MINESMSVLSEKYDNLLAEHEQSKQKIIKSEKNILSLNNKCVYLEKSNIALEQKVHELEQSSLKHNIEIVGIEQLPDEDVEKVVSKIGETMNVTCVDIESTRRTRQTKPGGKPASIIVAFKTSGTVSRDMWLAQRRCLAEITSNMITGGTLNNKIFINEDKS
ncbi:unnamed protein product [Leptidea sinapis]|uniref:Uncharacterized protein n=2 Tax=Leptidea sinapis TaxID=189913 RepID=A0A5E4R528_9NEOP|nr:unnamed protein product [Leptidea sinapis]